LGIEKDYSQAKAWYQKAADQGNADAKEGLKRLDGAASTVPSAPLSDLRKHKIDALISKKN
jgi:TPR repeat protein